MSAADKLRVSDLTVGQLESIMRGIVAEAIAERKPDTEVVIREDYTDGRYVYGIGGIARLIGRSKTYTQRIKSQGVLDEAITQRGRTIICDAKKAIELFGQTRKHKTN